jgi:hypothetical protein
VCWCSFDTKWLRTSYQIFSESKAVFHIHEYAVLYDLCLPITSFLLSQTLPFHTYFCTRWLIADLAVPVTCWISSETVFALSQNYWFGKMFWQYTHTPPHSTPCCTVHTVYSAANSWHPCIQWYHLLLFPLVIP